jgi:aryl-alcohol dehydrogenase-like predicted oxidoreductase
LELFNGLIVQTRRLGYTDLELTTVGLGAWAMGGPWQFGWGPQDDGEAIGAILTALEKGINWIDTAPVYGCGHSEELVGKALKQTSQSPFVATKCGLLWNEKRQALSCLKPKSIREECHASLKRLDIDVIDLYQMHRPEPEEDIEKAWEEMAKLAQEAKVRYIGVSNFNVEQIKRIQKIAPVASLQPPYSMLHREVEDELLNYCAENNIGVVVYSPMCRGLLTGKFSQERLAGLPLDDHRRRKPDFHEPQFTATLQLVDQLRPIAERNKITLAQLAISWVLRRSEVTAAIVGARRPEQIAETQAASDLEISSEDIEQIEQFLSERLEKIRR